MNKINFRNNLSIFLFAAKFLLSFLFPVLIITLQNKSPAITFMAFIELTFIASVFLLISRKNIIAANIFQSLCLVIYNFEYALLYFSNSFICIYLLANLENADQLSGSSFKYLFFTAYIFIVSLFPLKKINQKKNSVKFILIILVILSAAAFLSKQYNTSASYSLLEFGNSINRRYKSSRTRKESLQDLRNEFYKDKITDNIRRPASLNKKPNVIVIFTEGLSQHVIDDKRNLMQNVKDFQKDSICFKNYYNHTFATFMGLQGQLYSGYQYNISDTTGLASVQSILKKHGYKTSYLLTEPKSKIMPDYIASMNFDEVNSSDSLKGYCNSISDKDLYEMLLNKAEELSKENAPFFLATYTLGTHCSFDSIDEKFSDGKNPVLNKFYDADFQFGKFFDKFKKSDIYSNTILIFTSDHATYNDSDYANAFPEYKRDKPWLDKVPLAIHYKDIEPKEINTNGRNSIGLAPTILDLLDISDENFFLGTSLFSDETSDFDYTFESYGVTCSTKDSVIKVINNREIDEKISKYFHAKKSTGNDN